MAILSAETKTHIKRQPKSSEFLGFSDKALCNEGKKLHVEKIYQDVGFHARIVFSGVLTVGAKPWEDAYIWMPHWAGIDQVIEKSVESSQFNSPAGNAEVLHPVPYYIQNDNKDWKDQGSQSNLRHGAVQCGLTSLAMMLSMLMPWKEVQARAEEHNGQFENYVAFVFKQLGLRSISMDDHIKVLNHFGIKARATRNGTIARLKEVLEWYPTVMGLYYKIDGHFVCGIGFHRKLGWVKIHDPFGQRIYAGTCNQWRNICTNKGDTYGRANMLTPDELGRVFTDMGHDQAWFIIPEPGTPYYGGTDAVIHRGQAETEAVPYAAPSTALSVDEGCSIVVATQDTLIKADDLQSSQLDPSEYTNFKKGSRLTVIVRKADNNHIQVSYPDDRKINGWNQAYLWNDAISVSTPGATPKDEPGKYLTPKCYDDAAKEIGIDPAVLRAIVDVECKGSGFLLVNGVERPKILFEAQWFGYHTNDRYSDTHPHISLRQWCRDQYSGGAAEYKRLEAAIKLDKIAALKSASWGLPQIMGFNAESIGYKSVEEFVEAMHESEYEHLRAMCKFILSNPGILRGCKAKDWRAIARGYNGEAFAVHNYHGKLKSAYEKFK